MIVIHGVNADTLPRHVAGSLRDRLNVMPAVVVTGARQTGKSTLAQDLTPGRRRFRSLDDLDVLDAARRDPEAAGGRRRAGHPGATRASTAPRYSIGGPQAARRSTS